jgi:hypothetical protein
MNIEFTRSFDQAYEDLPQTLQLKCRKAIDQFIQSYESRQFPKGLRIHKCGPFLSISVTMKHRIFAYPITGGIRFVFIGDHEDANRYLKGK